MAQLSIVSSEPLPPPQPLTVVKTDPLPDQKPSAWRQFVSAATEAQPDDAQHNIFRSFYDEAARPIVGMIHDSIVRGDLGEKAASDILDSFKDQAKTFAAHPDIRNLPLVGPAATATANKMQQQYNAGNYQGMIGTAAGFVGALVAPEAHAAIVEKLPAVARAAATAADATAQWGEAAGAGLKAGAKAAAPDLTMAAKIGAPAIIAQRLAPGGAAGLIEGGADLVSAAQAARGIYRGAKAARAAYQDVRAAQATAAEVADAVTARAAQGPRVPIWQQGYADAEAARAAEAARPPTEPLWQEARAAGPGESAAETAPPAAETAPLTVIHSDPLPEVPTIAPARTPAQKLEDWIDEHTAYRRMQAQDLEWGNRARMADRYAEYFINNKLDPTPENIARATRDMGETKIPGGDETMPMIQERVAWHNARAAAAEAAPEAAGAVEATVYKGHPEHDWRTGKTITEFQSANGPWAGIFTSSEDVAKRFARAFDGPKRAEFPAAVTKANVRMERPFVIDAEGTPAKEFMADALNPEHRNPEVLKAINDPAFDGLVIRNTADEGDIFIPKSSNSIKILDQRRFAKGDYVPGHSAAPAAVNPLTAAPADVGAANASEVGAAPTAPEAKSLTEQQLEASIAALQPKRAAQAEARASAAEAPKPAAQASDAPEMQSLALGKHWVDSLQAHGLTTEEGARTVEMISRRTVMSDAEVSDLVKAATKNGTVKATGQDIAAAYNAQYPPETKAAREALELARLDNLANPAVPLVNREGVDRMARAIKQNGTSAAEAPAAPAQVAKPVPEAELVAPTIPDAPRPLKKVYGPNWEARPDAADLKAKYNAQMYARQKALKAYKEYVKQSNERYRARQAAAAAVN